MVAIHPEILKTLRKRRHLSQQALADATQGRNKVGIATIKRIETANGIYEARSRIAEGLAKALQVTVRALGEERQDPQTIDRHLRNLGYRRIKRTLDSDTALAFDMVERLYGIPSDCQIDMAPLLVALMAEGSLAWRREQLTAIDEATENLRSLGNNAGHLCFVNAVWRTENGAHGERESIEQRDLFGRHVSDEAYELGWDPEVNNPFVDYLRQFIKKIGANKVVIDEEIFGDFPTYRVAEGEIEALTGGDALAKHAISRGHAKIKDIPEDLLAEDKRRDRITWMVSRIPEGERKEYEEWKAEWDEIFGPIQLDNTPPPEAG